MHIDRRIAILGLLGMAALAVAMMAAPLLYPTLPQWLLLLMFWGGLILGVCLIGTATIIGFRGEASEPTIGHGRRMIALVGMIVFGLGFVGFAAVYFWPQSNIPPRAIVSEPPLAPAQLPSSPAPSSSAAGNPVLIEPPQSFQKNPDGSQRIFIRVLPHEISENFEGRTTNQAISVVAPYLHKWIAISGIVNDSTTYNDGTTIVHFISITDQTTVTVIPAEFGEEWRDNLSIINKGDTLKAVCRISKIAKSIINLDSCELITP